MNPYFLSAILRGFASAFLPIESVSAPLSSLASILSPSAMSGSRRPIDRATYPIVYGPTMTRT